MKKTLQIIVESHSFCFLGGLVLLGAFFMLVPNFWNYLLYLIEWLLSLIDYPPVRLWAENLFAEIINFIIEHRYVIGWVFIIAIPLCFVECVYDDLMKISNTEKENK